MRGGEVPCSALREPSRSTTMWHRWSIMSAYRCTSSGVSKPCVEQQRVSTEHEDRGEELCVQHESRSTCCTQDCSAHVPSFSPLSLSLALQAMHSRCDSLANARSLSPSCNLTLSPYRARNSLSPSAVQHHHHPSHDDNLTLDTTSTTPRTPASDADARTWVNTRWRLPSSACPKAEPSW
eukprot:1101312-Rhodomonas_salina.3